jgi:hypothetical protein
MIAGDQRKQVRSIGEVCRPRLRVIASIGPFSELADFVTVSVVTRRARASCHVRR